MEPLIDPQTGAYTGQLTSASTALVNAAYFRLQTPLGSYWADTTLGSKLYLLKRSKDTANKTVLAEQYATQALQPLLDDGRATSVSATATRVRTGWMALHITIVDSNAIENHFNYPVQVA